MPLIPLAYGPPYPPIANLKSSATAEGPDQAANLLKHNFREASWQWQKPKTIRLS
jgi:hypothetical protein